MELVTNIACVVRLCNSRLLRILKRLWLEFCWHYLTLMKPRVLSLNSLRMSSSVYCHCVSVVNDSLKSGVCLDLYVFASVAVCNQETFW